MATVRAAMIAALLLASVAAPSVAAPKACALSAADLAQVSQTIRSAYVALAKDDAASFSAVTAADFYAFEGKRINGPELVATIRRAHQAGRIYAWNLGSIEVRGGCDVAWAAWENHGEVGDATGMKPVTWLESAALHRDGSRWIMDFLHATRVPPAQ